jgi:proteasome accessory factor B
MHRVYAWLRDGEYPNCGRITAEFEVDRKTALRDIAFMQDRMGLPIVYDDKRHGYFFTGPVDGFPGVPVTEKELFGVCVIHKAIEQYRGTPLYQPLELTFQKLTRQLDDKERFTLQNLGEVLSFRPFAPDDADLRLFELVSRAVTERRALTFEYRKPGEKSAEARRVHPYHLMEFADRWYLLAHDSLRRAIRTFVLGRMSAPEITAERFVRPKDFDPKKHFDQSLGVMAGKGDFEVVIEMDAWLTDILRGRRWHPKQVWTELPGGGSQLRLRLSCLEEIEQYVLSWGTHATCVGPMELRRRLGNTATALVERYGKSGV